MKRRILTFFLAALFIGAPCVAGDHGVAGLLAKPVYSAKLKPKVSSGPGQRFGATGTAERLESNDWRLTLVFAGLSPDSVEEIRLLDDLGEPRPLSLQDADGKLAVAWEVPRERWRDKAPFALSARLQGQDKEALITVGHRATESKLTPLGHVARVTYAIAFFLLPKALGL